MDPGNRSTPSDTPEIPNRPFSVFNTAHRINTTPHRCPHLKVRVLSEEIEALADTGASLSVISSLGLLNKLGLQIQPLRLQITTADGTPYRCLGYVNLPLSYESTTHVLPTIVVPEMKKDLILGVDFLNKFGFRLVGPRFSPVGEETVNMIEFQRVEDYFGDTNDNICFEIHPISPAESAKDLESSTDDSLEMPTIEVPEKHICEPSDLVTEHVLSDSQREALFEVVQQLPATRDGNLGRTPIMSHSIDLLPGAKPKKVPPYRWSPSVEEVIDAEIERMKRLGVIEECPTAVDFLNPLLPIKKASGKWRICLDSRRLNQCTKKDDFPFPNMMGILQRIQKSKYFSVIDLSESYYQVPLDEAAKDKTAFRTNKGLFRFVVMPFGLTNAPATMARLMTKVIGHDLAPWVYVYLDDIIILSNTFEDHLDRIRIVADRLQKAGLTINLSKSKFCQTSIRYLGYVLSEDGLSMDVSKIQPVLDYPTPKTVKDIRRLLGLAGFYQKFIQNYSEITTPISNLLKKNRNKFSWTEEAEVALSKLKTALVTAPILANPDFNLPFIVETDSSDLAIGAVLVQMHQGERKCIAYFSKKLSSTQRRYSATERECLAVLLSIENFKHFIEGSRFVVQTDAMSLTFLKSMSIESKSPRIARWALKLSKYELDLQYKKGSENIPADALSRSINQVKVDLPDPYITQLMNQVEKFPERFPDFKIAGGKLYKFISNSTGLEDLGFRWKFVVPLAERRSIVKEIHEAAHLGPLKTLAKVRERFYWPRMATEIKRFCCSCLVCKESKVPSTNTTPVHGKPKQCSRPWEMISMDFLGPYPRSKKGNLWILVVCDFFSKFVMVQCLRSATAPAVCQFVENFVFNLFGVPEVCITDNAQVFKSDLFLKLLKRYEVTHWPLAVYHPGPNPTERVNRVIVTAIRCALNQKADHRDWDDSVHLIARAIRTHVHDSTGFTPYFVNFGRNMVSSGAEYEHLREVDDNLAQDPVKLNEEMKSLHKLVRENLLKAYRKYSAPYNLRVNRKHQFQEGDVVYKKNVLLSDKSRDFVGKFGAKYTKVRVRQVLGTNCYVLEDFEGKRIPGSYHGSFLKRA